MLHACCLHECAAMLGLSVLRAQKLSKLTRHATRRACISWLLRMVQLGPYRVSPSGSAARRVIRSFLVKTLPWGSTLGGVLGY